MTRKLLAGISVLLCMASIACTEKHYTKYQCPMKCEKEKTYSKPGNCPVCGMELEGIE